MFAAREIAFINFLFQTSSSWMLEIKAATLSLIAIQFNCLLLTSHGFLTFTVLADKTFNTVFVVFDKLVLQSYTSQITIAHPCYQVQKRGNFKKSNQ